MSPFAFLFGLGAPELIGLGVVGVLLFGRKLPEVGKYLGQSIVQFKKGMKGLEDEIDGGMSAAPSQASVPQPLTPPQRVAATAPKFQDAIPESPANRPQV
jgi:sec-independent protein translocase protein TatA